jgi:hypothetical protein
MSALVEGALPMTETIVFEVRTAVELRRAQQRRATLGSPDVPAITVRLAHGIATLRALNEGRFASVEEAAEQAGVEFGSLRLLLGLALLAPDIQREVLTLRPGPAAKRITVKALAEVAEPLRWAAQRRLWAKLKADAGVEAPVATGAARARRGR